MHPAGAAGIGRRLDEHDDECDDEQCGDEPLGVAGNVGFDHGVPSFLKLRRSFRGNGLAETH
jgi:hypothetical protein